VTRFQPGDEVYGMPFFPQCAQCAHMAADGGDI
jgi:hypothetical protein